jgi:hypothetical protein
MEEGSERSYDVGKLSLRFLKKSHAGGWSLLWLGSYEKTKSINVPFWRYRFGYIGDSFHKAKTKRANTDHDRNDQNTFARLNKYQFE